MWRQVRREDFYAASVNGCDATIRRIRSSTSNEAGSVTKVRTSSTMLHKTAIHAGGGTASSRPAIK
jgi:hypothetical protein